MENITAARTAIDESMNTANDKNAELIFNNLQLYFCKDYTVKHKDSNGITIRQPRISDFVTYGEKTVYESVMPFISNPTSLRVQLWEINIDWNKITDYQLFSLLITNCNNEFTEHIFGDVDFSKFKMKPQGDINNFILHNEEQNIIIDENIYTCMAKYIQAMFCITLKTEHVKGRFNKEDTIREEKFELAHGKNKNAGANLSTMISFCVNHPGFKYKLEELENIGIYAFMDSVNRLQIYESTSALMSGMYSGFCDTSKIDKEQFNFMRNIVEKR